MNGQELHQAGNLFWPPKPSCNSHQRRKKKKQQPPRGATKMAAPPRWRRVADGARR